MGKCDADSGVLFSACLPVSQSLRSDARCCDAGSRVVSPACPCVSQSLRDAGLSLCVCQPLRSDANAVTPATGGVPLDSQGLCGQIPDAVTLAPGRSPACLPVSPSLCGQCHMLRRRLRCRVSRLPPCLQVSPFKGQMLLRWLRGRVSRLSPKVSAVRCQML